ncbi:MAG TPA: type IV pilus secretin PilQ [Vicinamibacteria bacterium]|jgi:type IV pilus secretin PilQ/predicted competence protein|nr:type IV pilus secretin PilQ [Vicinamibacteria bacterium]
MKAKLAGSALFAAVILTAGAQPTLAQERTPTAISDIRQESNDHSTRLIIVCTGPLAYTYYSPDPLTLVVDVPEVDASKIPSRISVGTREVESLRVTSLARADGRNLARLEVRLASLVPYQIFSRGKDLNLVFERPAATAAARPPETAPSAPAPAAAAPAPVEVAKDEPPAPSADKVAAPRPEKAAAPDKAAGLEKAVPKNAPHATQILGVAQAEDAGQLTFTVRANGRLQYQDFFLGNPDRLVVDFPDVTARAAVRALEVNQKPVRKVRLAQFSAASPKVARLVLDLSSRAPYRIVEGADGLKILFGEGGHEPTPAPLAALRTAPEPEPAPVAAPVAVPVAVAAPAAPNPAPAALSMPVLPEPQIPAKESFEGQTIGQTGKTFTGPPISLDFKDGDLQDIFRLFADISGLNVVVNPGVSGKVTLKLTEVPWDQALDLILKTNGLGYTLEENVIRIAKLTDLQKEEQDRRKLQEEKALAGDLIDYTKRISYAKAGEMSEVIKKAGALSARGQINVDTRTNTIIIRDLPSYVEKSKDLIAELDRATPQVEIEARIVVTTRNFTRDLGIQWGFNQQYSPRFGNTTGVAFPNSIILNGGSVPGAGLPADQGGQASNAGIGAAARGYAVNLPASQFNSAIGISLGNVLGSFNLDLALTALERQGRGRLLSTPKVTTQNNQPAEIKQGVQIPIQTVANNTVTVVFKDAVLTLKVTPQITDAGTVILNLEVENNAADFSNLVNGIPPINTQSAKTIVLVKDGATAVVGGIYQSNEQTNQQRTPFLSKIPLLGYLFRNRFVTSTNNELLLFITPRITKG